MIKKKQGVEKDAKIGVVSWRPRDGALEESREIFTSHSVKCILNISSRLKKKGASNIKLFLNFGRVNGEDTYLDGKTFRELVRLLRLHGVSEFDVRLI